MRVKASYAAAVMGLLAAGSPSVFAGSHTWRVNEVFSNADGTIQFVELREMNGTPGETGIAGRTVTSTSRTFTITSNVASPTTNRHILFATPAFVGLPGAPTPDYIFPSGSVPFFSINGDTLKYNPYDLNGLVFGAGVLPTDGRDSLHRIPPQGGVTRGVNSPTNYAGQTGSLDLRPSPPGVPDGTAGSTPMDVESLNPAGSMLRLFFDAATCAGPNEHQIVYGQGSQLPTSPGGVFGLTGAHCGIGSASPFVWNGVPDATDGTGLLWWLIVVNEGFTTEGSWGDDSAGNERVGPGTGGSSGQCSVTARSLTDTCGH